MPKTQDVAKLSDEDLMKEWTALGEQVEKDRARLREFSAEHQKRERLRQLNLTAGDIALLQSVDTEGIESEEKVNI